MNELIQLPQYTDEGERIPDGAVYYWYNTTKEEQENIRLKQQVDMLIQTNAAITTLADDMKPVNKFFHNLQKKPAPSRMSKAEKEAYDDEIQDAAIAAKALKRLAKKGLQ